MSFVREDYKLSSEIALGVMRPEDAQDAGVQLAKISPWADIAYPAQSLVNYLIAQDPAAYKYAVLHQGKLAGVVCVRYPWLKGPYLELLGLFPDYQGKKIGSAVMAWFESTNPKARNLWLLASDFNNDAIAFYKHHGFEEIHLLEDLSYDGVHDILMRKKLFDVSR